jgi:hypothetical protein
MDYEQWRYLIQVLLCEESQAIMAQVLAAEIEVQDNALRLATRSSDWHAASQRLGRIDALQELPDLFRRFAEANKPDGSFVR